MESIPKYGLPIVRIFPVYSGICPSCGVSFTIPNETEGAVACLTCDEIFLVSVCADIHTDEELDDEIYSEM